MAATTYGVNSPSTVKLYSRKLFREALKNTTMAKYMGEGSDNMIQVLNDTKKGPGDSIKYQLRMQLSGSGVLEDGTLEGNEEALTVYTDTVLINQLRHAVRSGGKMTEQRVPFSIREEARMGLTDWWADRIDTAIINHLAGVGAVTDTRLTGGNATSEPTSTRIKIEGANATLEASITTTATMSLAYIDQAVATAKTATPLIRPLMVGGEPFYLLFMHPYQVYSLRTSTTTGQWTDIQKAAMTGGDVKKNPIFTGALGVYNGTILVENSRIPTALNNTSARRAIFCGAQAGVFAVGQDNSPEKMSWVEELFDYENQLGVSAGMIFGVKKTVFNSVDFGTIVLSTYATAP
jgi:N4-gp56 family major capsid protein